MVHQHFSIVPAMSVAENVALGSHGIFDARKTAERIASIGQATGIRLNPSDRAGSLSLSSQQQLEIVKALAQNARVLILDEPTAVLAPAEATQLLNRLRDLADGGMAIVLITHKLNEALSIADDVTVLRQGSTVLTEQTSRLTRQLLATAMLGAGWIEPGSPDGDFVPAEPTVAASSPRSRPVSYDPHPVVRAQSISVEDSRGTLRVRRVSIEVRRGEIVGIAGVEGSGVRELLRALGGKVPVAIGTIDRPRGIGFVPEDRHREALALDMSLTENMAMRDVALRSGIVPWKAFKQRTDRLLEEFDIRAPGSDVAARTLSGGNQQKLVLARELEQMPQLLIVENPTRGLDLQASAAVHARLRSARDDGMAIILYSSDLDELLAMADRTFAMYAGTLGETSRDRAAIGQAMLGG
jgi:simple sugar transport system ATP-binding protein